MHGYGMAQHGTETLHEPQKLTWRLNGLFTHDTPAVSRLRFLMSACLAGL